MNAKELADYRGKQISMIPQNPMTAFAPMVKLGKQLEMGFRFNTSAFLPGFDEKAWH